MGDRAINVVGAAIRAGRRCLVTRRGPSMSMPLKWEFPGGKVEPGESPEAALARELLEELGVVVEVGEHLGRGCASSPGREIRLDVFAATLLSGTLRLEEHSDHGWFSADELDGLDWPDADRPVLPAVKAWLSRGDA
jgi:8-oxo-dGTP diphosphatase